MTGCGCSPHAPEVIEMIERVPGKLWECPGCGSRQIKNMSSEEARKVPYLREHGTLNIRFHGLATTARKDSE